MKNVKNLVLITVDCLRFDAVSKDYTPFLWSLRKIGMFFTRAYSLSSWTTPSIVGLLTSTYPLMYCGDLTITYPRVSAAEVLQKAGYITIGLTFHPYLDAMFGFDRGFDVYYDDSFIYRYKSRYNAKNSKQKTVKRLVRTLTRVIKSIPGFGRVLRKAYCNMRFRALYKAILSNEMSFKLGGGKINEVVREVVSSVKTPFFLWVHYLDPHFPYIPRTRTVSREKIAILNVERERWRKFGKRPNSKVLDRLREIYLLTVYDVDKYIEEVIEYFKELGLYKETIFVITADHGEEFYEHKGFHHEIKLYEELIHVPLFIFGEKIKSREIRRPVSHIDLFPTLFSFLGLETPKEWIGHNMLSKQRNFVFSEEGQNLPGSAFKGRFLRLDLSNASIAIVKSKWKYINYKGREELYNLISDPNEQRNVKHENEEVLKSFRFQLEKHLSFVRSFCYFEKELV